MTADREQIPYPEKGSRKQHEQQSSTDIEHQQARQCRFSRRCYIENLQRRERPAQLLSQCALAVRTWLLVPSVRLFHRNRPRKQNVVLQVNVLVKIGFKVRNAL